MRVLIDSQYIIPILNRKAHFHEKGAGLQSPRALHPEGAGASEIFG